MTLQFEPIHLDRQDDYARHFSKCPQKASDYSFVNLWGWAEEYGLRWAWQDRLVWIKQTRPEALYWAPVGPWNTIDWARRFDEQLRTGSTFIRIPEALLRGWESALGDRIKVENDRGQWDYLYAADELIELKGNRFHKKKNLVNQFRRKYDYRVVPLNPRMITRALTLQEAWCRWHTCGSSQTLSAENRAIARVFQDWQKLKGLTGIAILVDQAVAGYTVAEFHTDDTLLIHFEKGDTAYKGVYQAMSQMFLAGMDKRFRTINREQDLDDEGLRKAKLSYQPVDFLRKYRVIFA